MSRDERVGLGPVFAGAVASLAVTTLLLLVGAAVGAGSGELDAHTLAAEGPAVAIWVVAAAAVGAFVGGRTAAMACRALVRRDGALGGFITGSLFALLALAGGSQLALLWPAERAADFLWGMAILELAILVGATIGGMRGARSEARAIGLRTVRRRPEDRETYERDFFGGASLSSSATSGSNLGIP
jgi:hypothetical protein